ncbi:hypothetical protein C489_19861 [Natrinema versiforme JCM 10478]|uniref:Uncharacterized protein n=1 Tax=Natrinema versiforme JCM 10478 TaxID=1227496 RepID=L9XNX5_9EURY|nr:hypothetical protein C489_19861 [Natrinema versiforme JCM 10478]
MTVTTGRSTSGRSDWVVLPNSAFPVSDRFLPPITVYSASISDATSRIDGTGSPMRPTADLEMISAFSSVSTTTSFATFAAASAR